MTHHDVTVSAFLSRPRPRSWLRQRANLSRGSKKGGQGNPRMTVYSHVRRVSGVTWWDRAQNRPVSGGSKRAHSVSPLGHLFPLKRDRPICVPPLQSKL